MSELWHMRKTGPATLALKMEERAPSKETPQKVRKTRGDSLP